MAETPIEKLQKARSKLVEERRQQVANMVDMNAESFINNFLRAQTAIEGIDRAIEDEKHLTRDSKAGQ